MSYVSQSHANRPAAVAGVIAIHAGLGAIIVLGLQTNVVNLITDGPVAAFDVKDEVEPPPPPPPPVDEPQVDPVTPPLYVPPAPIPLPTKPNFVDTTSELPPMTDEVILKVLPPVRETPPVKPTGIPAVGASPRNNPGAWVTDADYKSRWIREGLSGTARFKLEIGSNGRVESCQITQSTGHPALDEATCDLVSRRARFDAAKDTTGTSTRGTYSNAVRWQMPD